MNTSASLTVHSAQPLPAWLSNISGTLTDALASAKLIIDSGFGPKDCKGPAAIVVAVAMGRRLGLDPFTAIHGIAVVNGRPSLFGDALLAVCMNHAEWGDFEEAISGAPLTPDWCATCTVTRKGRKPYAGRFSFGEATRAQLAGKQGPWSAQPQRMMMMRARAFALRGAFADALAGFHAREELEDEPRDVTASATVHDGLPVTTVAKAEPARIAPAEQQPPATGEATTGTTNDAGAREAKAEPAKEAKAPHPSIIAGRELMRNLGTAGSAILPRLVKLHGGVKAADIPADRLDAFGLDLATIATALKVQPIDWARIEDLLGGWEREAQKAGAK